MTGRFFRPAVADLRRGEAMSWGPPPAAPAPAERSRLRLLGFRPLVKNSLRGFADVELPIGLKIHDVPVLVGKTGPGPAFQPSHNSTETACRSATPAAKPSFVPILQWRDRELSNKFSAAVVELVRRAHPEAFDGDAPL